MRQVSLSVVFMLDCRLVIGSLSVCVGVGDLLLDFVQFVQHSLKAIQANLSSPVCKLCRKLEPYNQRLKASHLIEVCLRRFLSLQLVKTLLSHLNLDIDSI
jgi:hypothetical protein